MYNVRLTESYNAGYNTVEYDRYRELDDEIYKVLNPSCWERLREMVSQFFSKKNI